MVEKLWVVACGTLSGSHHERETDVEYGYLVFRVLSSVCALVAWYWLAKWTVLHGRLRCQECLFNHVLSSDDVNLTSKSLCDFSQ